MDSAEIPRDAVYQINDFITNQTTGTARAGRKFSVLQSLRFRRARPLPVIINPPTMRSSDIRASLTAWLDRWATSQNMPCQRKSTGVESGISEEKRVVALEGADYRTEHRQRADAVEQDGSGEAVGEPLLLSFHKTVEAPVDVEPRADDAAQGH